MKTSTKQSSTSSPQESELPPDDDEPVRVNEAGGKYVIEDEARYQVDPDWTGRA